MWVCGECASWHAWGVLQLAGALILVHTREQLQQGLLWKQAVKDRTSVLSTTSITLCRPPQAVADGASLSRMLKPVASAWQRSSRPCCASCSVSGVPNTTCLW